MQEDIKYLEDKLEREMRGIVDYFKSNAHFEDKARTIVSSSRDIANVLSQLEILRRVSSRKV